MKFKRLYLHGFKSFVDKTALDFPDGITAVVGPNGSGKSNIMDAVRWVFGEQSAKELRGTDMDDVVFNGSAKRKPAGFAEVALTLSDIDDAIASKYGTFSDITITRKFYRSGEREYYINNRKCRLKDIKDIFMDTGLGARSISIIEQGKVDKIINATPEELRFFLEETAGVTKFKDKKKDAEKRLQQTRENLNSLNNIIEEVFKRIEVLTSQVEKLKISEELQAKKRNLDKQFLAVTYSLKKDESDKYHIFLEDKKRELTERIRVHTDAVNLLATTNNEYARMEIVTKECTEKKYYTASAVTSANAEVNNLKERLTNAEGLKLQISGDLSRETKRLEELILSRDKIQQESIEAEKFTSEMKDKLEEMNEIISDIKLAKDQVDDDFALAQKVYLEQTQQISDLRSEQVKRETTLDNYNATTLRLTNDKIDIDKQIERIITSINNLDLSISTISLELKNNETKLNEEKAEYNKIKGDADFYKLKQSELQGRLHSLKSNIEFLDEQIVSYTIGSADDSKVLKPFKAKLLIDDLKKYPKEKLLDLSDILVFNDEDYDKVLDVVSNIKSSLRFTFRSKVSAIATMIDDNMIAVINSSIMLNHQIFKKLGEDDKGIKILKLKEKIAQDSEQISLIDEELAQSNKILDDILQVLDAKAKHLDTLDEKLRTTRDIYTKSITELDNFKSDHEKQKVRLFTLIKDIEIAQNARENVEKEISELTLKVETLAKTQLQSEDDKNALEAKQEFMMRELDNKKEEASELRIEFNKRNERVLSFARELENISKQNSDITSTINNLKDRYETLVNVDEATWKVNLDNLLESIKQLNINALSAEEDSRKAESEFDIIRNKVEEYRKDIDIKNEFVRESERVINQTEVNLASTTTSLENISQQYLEKFAKDIVDEYSEHLSADFDHKRAKDDINKLEQEIEKLGPINLNAKNDYSEADERYQFLTTQRDDLESSIADINSFIAETDGTTASLFETTFNSVREKFLDVFHILFGNGEAELRLTDPDNILISGVEIYIQPPGKKLQHMGLLSGGEKALTAMTLLFALFLQKPTPFCFLDEVDAPLDDANVERYTNMVKTLSDKTQFILITHNHNTMAVADSLYGVKMQESGVSSILSVKLDHSSEVGR